MNDTKQPLWHHLATETLPQHLEVDAARGLSEQEVVERREKYGLNRLTPKKGKSAIMLFLSQFHHPLIYILLVAGFITGFLKSWVDASVIFGVVLVNAIIGFIQEMNALRAIAALARSLSVSAAVLRAGVRVVIPAEELVPGDMVFLQSGDKVPADLRLLRSKELQIDESALTGESVPVEKKTAPLPVDTLLADRNNLAYSSTLVTYGTGVGIVVESGDRTEIGRINRLISEATELQTPLTRKIGYFSKLLMWFIIGLAAVTFLAGWIRGADPVETFVASIALAVAAIPEGLPVAVTVTLAIGMKRMARRRAIIRKLPAVETLGGTTIICSDKTGTLTQNQMTVQHVYAGGERFEFSGSGYTPEGEIRSGGQIIDPASRKALLETLQAGLLCNDARLVADVDAWRIEGDPTEGALLVSAHKAGLHREPVEQTHPRLDAIPFESAHQFMATLHHNQTENARHIYLKGSVESILKRCETVFDANLNPVALDADAIQQQVNELAARGLRVLAFARGTRNNGDAPQVNHEHVITGLTFLGLQAMIDPPRPEAIEAVARSRQAGVHVKMITGDHIGTATAIARQIGLVDANEPMKSLDGRALAAIAPGDLAQAAEDTTVFARVAPEQKLNLVTALQSRGHIVAMTGDGVNDAPALRQANIGVAMGITGTEVSKEAAAMVLTDDNFATIAAAVEEGRGVYDNLVKFITWTLPTNIGQGLVILIAVFAGMVLPILPGQVLWLNMTTAVLLGLPLAFEAKEHNIMRRPPRHPEQPILTGLLVFRTVLVGLMLATGAFIVFEWEMMHNEDIAKARTAAVNVFAVGQSFYLLNCRSLTHSMFKVGLFSNLWVWGGISAMMLAQVLFMYTPAMNWLFHTQALGYQEWLLSAAAGFVVYVVIGAEKLVRNLYAARRASSEAAAQPVSGDQALAQPETAALSRRALANSRWALGFALLALFLSMASAAFVYLRWQGLV
ncbi:MAG: cation-transporting P-type ATPase [Methylomonas sp.]|nr:cation-transporting P-type ATPase [Methylomonas sp.]PPD19506.1 MAG: carbonate dehydratase [Methylomonas sp.]PPD24789.1 MAG: carbonate dehydratase [Methylomonas sp.]PPD33488.1 MAG: carbonate dehydratase [Methylomonas sp.]PPD38396.1 MAG: carbonate dehydratase [Methylomonas sp.]